MIKAKFMVLTLAGMLALSSCGIFGKGCGCPKFGKVNHTGPENIAAHIA